MDAPSDALAGFASFRLSQPLLTSLAALGYEEPTPIQRAAIPPLLDGRDVLGQAATGTGKTAAFALPLLERVTAGRGTRALVLVPTRELAVQVAGAVGRYGEGQGASVLAIYGGASMGLQVKALARGVTVVVATPGRALDHLRRGTLDLSALEVLVLDEADEMLDMGFAEDLEAILAATPATRQTALFSATLPPRILSVAKRHLRDPVRIAIAHEALPPGEVPRVRQTAYLVLRAHKPAALTRILDLEGPASAIVFCRTRTEVDELVETLGRRGHRAEALHGGMSQEQRDRAMKRFRAGASRLLVATDVAARGLDIEHVSHVINYDVPSEPEAYVHRIGRTGRAGREGVALTLTEPREQRLLHNIEVLVRQRIAFAPVPTNVDLRARRLELTRAAVEESLAAADLDDMRPLLASLTERAGLADIAAAALRLVHRGIPIDDAGPDVPTVRTAEKAPSRPPREAAPEGPARARPSRPTTAAPESPTARSDRKAPPRARHGATEEMTRLYVGAGSEAGMRPSDLVGAIANEAGIPARAIGAIQISERYSLVEVAAKMATHVIEALKRGKLKGRKVVVRRDRSV